MIQSRTWSTSPLVYVMVPVPEKSRVIVATAWPVAVSVTAPLSFPKPAEVIATVRPSAAAVVVVEAAEADGRGSGECGVLGAARDGPGWGRCGGEG
jgi:hypothetical protein